MKLVRYLALLAVTFLTAVAQDKAPADPQQAANTTAAAAATARQADAHAPDFLEHLVDSVLELFDVRSNENTVTHYVIAALFLVGALLLRRIVVTFVFGFLK